jgi:hypothetical protein
MTYQAGEGGENRYSEATRCSFTSDHGTLPLKEAVTAQACGKESHDVTYARQGNTNNEKAQGGIGSWRALQAHELSNDNAQHCESLSSSHVTKSCPLICCSVELSTHTKREFRDLPK